MEDSHPDWYTFHGDPTSPPTVSPTAPPAVSPAAPRRAAPPSEHPSHLVQTLREARWRSGLEIDDLAEITNIRFFHLEALEAGRLAEIPGDAQGKSLIRRYAHAVGLDPARALMLYAQERRNLPTYDLVRLELPSHDAAGWGARPRFGRLARLLGSLLLVAGASWFALRVFDSTLNSATAGPGALQMPQSVSEPTLAPVGATPALTTSAAPAMILLSLQTTPPGAEISIDGYRFAQSPIVDAPVRAGNRTIKVTRGGYGTFERTLDLSQDRRLNVTLFPKGVSEPTVTGAEPASAETPAQNSAETPAETPLQTPAAANPAAAEAPAQAAPANTNTAQATGQVVVTVLSKAWLEVYRGSARGGERLVYETAEPGATYSFDAPVYIFSGNAGGVSVAEGDAAAQPLGTSGAVLGRAY